MQPGFARAGHLGKQRGARDEGGGGKHEGHGNKGVRFIHLAGLRAKPGRGKGIDLAGQKPYQRAMTATHTYAETRRRRLRA
ncbi:hypothetical protein STA1M1_27340 [Sinisalibacter aestuarii]|uniref:Uncharacterized protein n=1 Tax=Sinisalibacter aestuarii TaxID=2949426 RepID=A0ABQ5LV51_9RHOB|nr:hypothetical protein STA1M1_27340 [Sinisalibacter aestuarii]